MYRVLLPVDDDEHRALHQAKYVAGLPNAAERVAATVLHVVPAGTFETADEADFAAFDAAVAAADHLDSAGVSVTRTLEDGGVASAVVAVADETDCQEVVMGGRKRSGVAQVLLGSTVLDVFLSTERPVTVTGRDAVLGGADRHVLVPVDRNVTRATHQAEYVADLAETGADLSATVLYVFPHQDYAGAPDHEFAEVEAAVEAADLLESRGVTVDRLAVGGEVTRRILRVARERNVGSVVVGGRKRSGVQKVLMGSTAQDVVISADRPVTLTG